jgi:hypothetical protein
MLSHQTNLKIRPDHLDRQALIYIRQSTMLQVRDHTGSTTRQYDLTERALALGWPQEHIRVIDQDQGHSGASAAGRDGFQSLVAEVGLKHAGAVLRPGSFAPGPLLSRLVSPARNLRLDRHSGH